jgi:hypothetical protein
MIADTMQNLVPRYNNLKDAYFADTSFDSFSEPEFDEIDAMKWTSKQSIKTHETFLDSLEGLIDDEDEDYANEILVMREITVQSVNAIERIKSSTSMM